MLTENHTLACVFGEGGVNCILPMDAFQLGLRFGLPGFGFKVRLWHVGFGFTVPGFGFKVLFFCLDSGFF